MSSEGEIAMVESGKSTDGCNNKKLFKESFSWRWYLVYLTVFLVTSTIVGVIIGIISSNSGSSRDLYSPGDSRILSLNQFFCEAGILEVRTESIAAEMFLLDSTPPLNDTDSFTVAINSTVQNSVQLRQYHLHPNSNISVGVNTNSMIDVYIVKGNSNANRWMGSPSDTFSEAFAQIVGSGSLEYTVPSEDDYFIFLHNPISSVAVDVTSMLTLDRFQYSPPADVQSCSVEQPATCRIPIPYSSSGNQLFLVRTAIPAVTDYLENVSVRLRCDNRNWTYSVVIVVPLLFILILLVIFIILRQLYLRQKKNRNA